MKLIALSVLAGASSIAAQSAQLFVSNDNVLWTDIGAGKDEDTGEAPEQVVAETSSLTVYTAGEDAEDQAEVDAYIETQRKKHQGIYDPNMYPYGPLYGDYRAPGADDAVSDAIQLPSSFPFF